MSTADGKFAQYLVSTGAVDPDALQEALALRVTYPHAHVGELLVHLDHLDFQELMDVLAAYRQQARLGEILVMEGDITKLQLEAALIAQAKSGLLLGKILVEMGACTMSKVMHAIALQRRQVEAE